MFKVGDYVSYGNSGVCQIVDMIWMNSGASSDTEKQYYVLQPVYNTSGKIYTPIDNDRVIMRNLISYDMAEALLADATDIMPIPEAPPREMDAEYKKRIRSGDCRQWMSIIKTVKIKKNIREKKGKKLTSSDERYLKEVSGKLYEELSFVMKKNVDQVKEIVEASLVEDV